ncbi:3-dehydroquinate synthase II [Paenibacillus sp. L3-i20]|uniref:3-dehydroquinate synthase II n=1 Tax=Paenibacillus sp. L3-i20 TaxID=2905833 RepID=UPI001EE07717|nr:3-dehydroquinate synthase II [Paenibacillus sp. L3-i20]GKU77247.1 3-dehydroquinate synthase II [Paenibacillus sp. L3-i20]
MNNKKVWYDARTVIDNNFGDCIALVNQQSCFHAVLLNPHQVEKYPISERLTTAVMIKEIDEIEQLDEQVKMKCIWISENLSILETIKRMGLKTGWYVKINDQETMNKACDMGKDNPYLILEFKDDTNIPLELVLAKLQRENVEILKQVRNAENGRISSDVMESGSDGVLLASESIGEIVSMNEIVSKSRLEKLEIVKATVKKVTHIGAGERACIDTTSLLTEKESMVIGSTSSGGLLVCSETHYLPYMNTRPFRVNAGAVHSYVWCPGGMTEYITDMKVGTQVLAVDYDGNARTVNVGRMKIEVRPLLLIEAEYEGQTINTIVQDDWHIRIFDGDRQPKSATTFQEGDSILAYVCEPGRHVGVKITETITER